jgi:HK97 family phage major capsid protein
MATNAVSIPYVQGFDRSSGVTHGGVQFFWVDEEGQLTGVKPKLGQIGLRLRKLVAMAYVSNEMIEDSPQSMEALLRNMFSESLQWALEGVILNGSGIAQPLGIFNSPCLIAVDKEPGQQAATILYENIIKMFARQWRKGSALWVCNDDTLPQLATMNLAVGTGGAPVYIPAGGASAAPYSTLLGRPVIFSEHCRSLGAKGDIYFCDWSQYLLGQKSTGIKWDASLHLKFDFDQMAFRVSTRIDGQPWWNQALQPRYSSATVSPFVTLAVRE